MRSLFHTIMGKSGGASYGALTTAWISATGETDVTILGALNTLETNGNSQGWLSKIKYLYPLVGGTSTKHKYNFINPAVKQITWAGGVTHSATGAQGNGTTGLGDTGILVSDFTSISSLAFGIYSRTNIQGIYADLGAQGADDYNMYAWAVGGNYFRVAGGDGSQVSTATNSLGTFIGNRINSTTVRCLSNGVKTSKTVANISASTGTITIMQSLGNFSPREYSFFFFADSGLTDTDLDNLNTEIQAFQTTLGRQV